MKACHKTMVILAAMAIAVNYSCNNNHISKKEKYNLTILVDTVGNLYLDSLYISSDFRKRPGWTKGFTMDYDSVHGAFEYTFDSIDKGEVKMWLQTELDLLIEKKITLLSDTVIYITKKEDFPFQKGDPRVLSITDINPGEKLCISMGSVGCFHYYKEKMIIKKSGNQYVIDFFSTRQTETPGEEINGTYRVDSTFKDSLRGFQESLVRFAKLNQPGYCTTSSSYSIQKGDTIYTVNDLTCNDSIAYYKLLRLVKPEWFIPQNDN